MVEKFLKVINMITLWSASCFSIGTCTCELLHLTVALYSYYRNLQGNTRNQPTQPFNILVPQAVVNITKGNARCYIMH